MVLKLTSLLRQFLALTRPLSSNSVLLKEMNLRVFSFPRIFYSLHVRISLSLSCGWHLSVIHHFAILVIVHFYR
jgi:hypothetical protein